MKIGLMRANDSSLLKNKRVPDKQAARLFDTAEAVLSGAGFDVSQLSMLQVFNNETFEGLQLQFTITEDIETSMTGKKVNYRVPVTMLIVWMQDDALKSRHVEKVVLSAYQPYSPDLITGMLEDAMALVIQRLKRKAPR